MAVAQLWIVRRHEHFVSETDSPVVFRSAFGRPRTDPVAYRVCVSSYLGRPRGFSPWCQVFKFSMWLVALLLTVYAIAFIIVPRLRDVGISPYLGLLSVLPLINCLLFIFLAFASTGRNARHYWEALQNERRA